MGAIDGRFASGPLDGRTVSVFDSARLLEALRVRGVRLGVATSVRTRLWEEAEIYPRATNPELRLTPAQMGALARFGG